MDQNEMFQILADNIVDSAKKEWTTAHLEVKVLGATVNTKLRFEYLDNPMGWEFMTNQQVASQSISAYHKALHETGNAKWNKMPFKLSREGKFETEFEWDQALQDEYERNSRTP